jgi:hypothetical protein
MAPWGNDALVGTKFSRLVTGQASGAMPADIANVMLQQVIWKWQA